MPTTVLMGTVCPSPTRISTSVPATGEGISASTLSVEISKIGSSRLTDSPTFFIHFVIVPSAIDSPICGMMISVAIAPPPKPNQNSTVPAAVCRWSAAVRRKRRDGGVDRA
jgi:hypothetical protein